MSEANKVRAEANKIEYDKFEPNKYNLDATEVKNSRISVVLNAVIFLSDFVPYVSNGFIIPDVGDFKYKNKTLKEILDLEYERLKELERDINMGVVSHNKKIDEDKITLEQLQDLFDLYPDTKDIVLYDSVKTNENLKDVEEINAGIGLYVFKQNSDSGNSTFIATRGSIEGEFSGALRDIALGNFEVDKDLFENRVYDNTGKYKPTPKDFMEAKCFSAQDQYAFDAFYYLIKDLEEESDQIFITGYSLGGHKALYTYFKWFLELKRHDGDNFNIMAFKNKYKCMQVNSPGFTKAAMDYFKDKINSQKDFDDLCSGITAICSDTDIVSPMDKYRETGLYKSIFFEGNGHDLSQINIKEISDCKPSYITFGQFLEDILKTIGSRREKNPNETFSKATFVAVDKLINGTRKNIFGDDIKVEWYNTFVSLFLLAYAYIVAYIKTWSARRTRVKLFDDIERGKKYGPEAGDPPIYDQEQFYTEEYKALYNEVREIVKLFFDPDDEKVKPGYIKDIDEKISEQPNLRNLFFKEIKKGISLETEKLTNLYDRKAEGNIEDDRIEYTTNVMLGFVNLFVQDEYKKDFEDELENVEPGIFGTAWQMLKNFFRCSPRSWANAKLDRKADNICDVTKKIFDSGKFKFGACKDITQR